MGRWAIVIVALAACRSSGTDSTRVPPEPSKAPPDVPATKCSGSFDSDGRLVIGGTASSLTNTDFGIELDDSFDRAPTAVHGLGSALLIGYGDRLWRVSCDAPAVTEPTRRAETDFGRSALAPDGATLFVTAAGKVAAYDLATGAARSLTKPPLLPTCWDGGDDGKTRAIDRVLGMTDGGSAVAFERGGPCGFEGDWSAVELHLVDPLGTSRSVHGLSPVSSVAVDAAGHIWLGQSGRCDEPGIVDPSTRGVVASADGGKTWQVFDTRTGPDDSKSPAALVVADARQAGHVIAVDPVCGSSAATIGGTARVTRDGGEHWQKLRLPDNWIGGADDGEGIAGLAIENGNIDHVIVWSQSAATETGGESTAMASADGGKSWGPYRGALRPIAPRTPARLGETMLTPTEHGLFADSIRLWPPAQNSK